MSTEDRRQKREYRYCQSCFGDSDHIIHYPEDPDDETRLLECVGCGEIVIDGIDPDCPECRETRVAMATDERHLLVCATEGCSEFGDPVYEAGE